ncbi:hypothetical protein [Endozoicomonas numazuensis]|uniref:Uncharacterized protein n=1 Tax=Endozoicomonas numazuensis TaxID=1137799 RepID=A0A081NFR1_9GAMM|nr:hypothetical protein [Endozoicomonas numazuensis]KEQ17284.1 hypothetical protein GZ78_15815 [Endozoicomonas numazuensis]
MNNPLKLFTASLILLFSGEMLADLITNNPNPRKRDIRKSSVKQLDLYIYIAETSLSPPSAKDFSLELNCFHAPLWDLFGWLSKPVYSTVFECPTEGDSASNICYKIVKLSELPDELASNVSCSAQVTMEDVVYEYSTQDYGSDYRRWNFPLEYPYIGLLDAIFLPLNEATASYSRQPVEESLNNTDNNGR